MVRVNLNIICRSQNEGTAADPFRNGLLKRIDADQQLEPMTQSDQVLDTAELMEVFDLKGRDFERRVEDLNELNVRRLNEMAQAADATAGQISFLKEHIASHYRLEGDTPTWRELNAGPEGSPSTVS